MLDAHKKEWKRKLQSVEANVNEKYGLKKKTETHPLCKSCNYKFTVDTSDVSAT